MDNQYSDKFFDRLKWARGYGAFQDRLGRSIRNILWQLPDDQQARDLAESRIQQLERLAESGRLPPFKVPHLSQGDLALGISSNGTWVRLMLSWLCSGCLLVSNTGGGKTNLIAWLTLQLGLLNRPVWLIEPYKLQLRRLLPLFTRMPVGLIVLPWQNWRWNLLQNNLRDPHQHIAMAVELLVRGLDLPGRAAAVLRHGIHHLYRQFGIWTGGELFPTLYDLYEWVHHTSGLNPPARDAILDRLGAFLVALTPQCGAWRLAWRPKDLAQFPIVFEFRGCADMLRKLIPQSLLFSTFQARIEAGLVNCGLALFIIFDDCQWLVDQARAAVTGDFTPLDEMAGIVRGSGIGFCPAPQTLVGFSRRLRPNLTIKVFGRLGIKEDYDTIGGDCDLNPEQQAYAMANLKPGIFIGRVNEGDWTEPFLFRVPLLKIPAERSEDEIAHSLAPLAALPTRFADEFAHWEPHHIAVMQNADEPEQRRETLDDVQLRLLGLIVETPGKSVSYYARQARINGTRLAKLRQDLVELGYIREHSIATSQKGRTSIIIEPLAAGREAVRGRKETSG